MAINILNIQSSITDTLLYTPSTSTDTCLVVSISSEDVGNDEPITAISFGATSMTLEVIGEGILGSNANDIAIAYLVNPGTTQQTITVTGGQHDRMGVAALTLDNVDQTLTVNVSDSTFNTVAITAITTSATTTKNDCKIISAAVGPETGTFLTVGATKIVDVTPPSSRLAVAESTKSTAGVYSHDWVLSVAGRCASASIAFNLTPIFKVYWIPTQEVKTMKKNVAGQVIGTQLINSTDGTSFTGTATALITIDGGTQSASAGTGPTHEGNGYHSYLPTQAETNGDQIAFTFTGAITSTVQVYTTFPQTVDNDVILQTLPLETDIVSAGAITTLAGAIVNVDLVDVTTANTDMRGTDGANTTTPPTTTQIWAEATRELTSGNNIVLAKGVGLTGLNDITSDSVLSAGDIDGFTLEQSQRLILSSQAGKTSGMETSTATIRNATDTKTRITATVDSSGNRSVVTLDAN